MADFKEEELQQLRAQLATQQAQINSQKESIANLAAAKAKAEAAAAAAGDDSDDDAPRMNMGWSADDKEARPPTVSMARRMMSALGLSSKSTAEDVDRPRGSSLGRALGLVDTDGNLRDPRSGSIGRVIFSEGSGGELVAFRGVRKMASRVRKTVTGKSSSEAHTDAIAYARNMQETLRYMETPSSAPNGGGGQAHHELMALVGQRRREWQTVYLHVYSKGLGLIEIVDKLLKFGITLQDLHELATDECKTFGDDYDDPSTDAAKDDAAAAYVAQVAAAKASGEPSPPPPPGSSLDEDLAIDTGCSIQDARRLRRAVMKFFKGEKALGFLRGHANSDGTAANYYQTVERLLLMGLLPEDVSPDKLDSDPELAQKVSDGLVDSEALASLGVALKHYDKVAAAVAEFDAKSTGDEACFTMDLSKPMGLRLDDDTLVVLGVSPGGQAEEAQVPLGARIMSVAGEACSVVEDAIAVMARERDRGEPTCDVVYREFNTATLDDLNPLMDDDLLAESAEKDDI